MDYYIAKEWILSIAVNMVGLGRNFYTIVREWDAEKVYLILSNYYKKKQQKQNLNGMCMQTEIFFSFHIANVSTSSKNILILW